MTTTPIPEKWLLAMHQRGYTTAAAVAHWQEQERMAAACTAGR